MMRVASIGDRVHEGSYRVHSRFAQVVNCSDGRRLVTVVAPGIGMGPIDGPIKMGPINIVIEGLACTSLHTLRVNRKSVWLDSRRYDCSTAHTYHSGIDLEPWDPETFGKNLVFFAEQLAIHAPRKSLAFLLDSGRDVHFRGGFEGAFIKHAGDCVGEIFGGNLLGGIGKLKGCGFGLTPSGDDFIAGLLCGLNVLERAYGWDLSRSRECVYEAARSGNLLADVFLGLARDGRVCQATKCLLAALLQAGSGEIRRSTAELCRMGQTSGADFATGFLMTLRNGNGALSWS